MNLEMIIQIIGIIGFFAGAIMFFVKTGEYKTNIQKDIETLKSEHYQGLTILGGEPLDNVKGLLPLVKHFRKEFGDKKDIWCFTGFTYQTIIVQKMKQIPELEEFLSYIDVLVDGPFEMDKKDIRLVFRGSSNQRLIDMKATNKQGHIVLLK